MVNYDQWISNLSIFRFGPISNKLLTVQILNLNWAIVQINSKMRENLSERNVLQMINNFTPCTPLKEENGKKWALKNTASQIKIQDENELIEKYVKGSKKRPWTPIQDNLLKKLVTSNGARDWSQIALSFDERSGKQCRERWHNHLREGVVKSQWSLWEQWILTLGVLAHGNKWSTISKYLPGRPDNTVKNHWNCKMRPKKSQLLSSAQQMLEKIDQYTLSPTEQTLLRIAQTRRLEQSHEDREPTKTDIVEQCKKALVDFYRLQIQTDMASMNS